MILAWLVFPLLFGLLCLGCGLLVQRLTGRDVPGALLIPLGFALVVVAAQAMVLGPSPDLATPLVIALAVAGLVSAGSRLRRLSPDRWVALAALGVFAVFAAPVVLSGDATFAGYTVLGDTSIHFILVDRLMEHGRDLSGLPASSYKAALDAYFDTAYPIGAHVALGSVRPLVGQDVAWLFQPFLAMLAAMLSLALYSLLAGIVERRALRAAIAFVAAQPALVYAYSLQGSIKELATVVVIATLLALVPLTVGEGGVRRLVPLAIVSAAALAVLGPAVVPWLAPLLLACAAALAWKRRPGWLGPTARDAGFLVALAGLLSLPVLTTASDFVRKNTDTATSQSELGNLLGPLDRLQAFGIWLEGDYRLKLGGGMLTVSRVLIVLAVAAAAGATVWLIRRRAWLPLLYAGISLLAWAYVTSRGSPWADAKALMIVSTPIVLLSLLGAAALAQRGRALPAWLVVCVLGAGVLWSNALAYHDVRLAPRERLAELGDAGERLDGDGPTLYLEFEEFAKHFLRDAQPVAWSEPWQVFPGAPGGRFGFAGDSDQVPLPYLQRFRTLVLRRSPSASRPPASFRLESTSHDYEVWRHADSPQVARHLPLGGVPQPGGALGCAGLPGAFERAPARRTLHLARERLLVASPAAAARPSSWKVDPDDPLSVRASGSGRATQQLVVPASAVYDVWLQGSFGREVTVAVDGRTIGSIAYELNGRGEFGHIGRARLAGGRHTLTVTRGDGDLHPGNGGGQLLGPVVMVQLPDAKDEGVRNDRPARRLCREWLDWVELAR
jgi:hypothetical protein